MGHSLQCFVKYAKFASFYRRLQGAQYSFTEKSKYLCVGSQYETNNKNNWHLYSYFNWAPLQQNHSKVSYCKYKMLNVLFWFVADATKRYKLFISLLLQKYKWVCRFTATKM